MAVSISLAITQNSQSIANNTSNVTVSVNLKWDSGSWNAENPAPPGWLKIDGVQYDFRNTFNESQVSSGSKTLFTKTVDVAHGSNGAKTLSCSASFDSGTGSGTVTATAEKELATIARASSFSVTCADSKFPLGKDVTFSISRKDSSFKHTVTYECGSTSGTIKTKTESTSFAWPLPLSLAQQNKTGTSVKVTFKVTTYSGSTAIGTAEKTVTCYIPDSVAPTCTLKVSEATSYGAYIKDVSKLKIVVTPTEAQGSAIAAYKVTADGVTYTTATVTTGKLSTAGTLTITATVTDKRGRTGSASTQITVVTKSVLSDIANGTLDDKDNPISIKWTEGHSSFKHRMTYTCGSRSGYIVGGENVYESEATSVNWTPPLYLAAQNTTGTSVPITIKLTTYTADGTAFGTSTKTITCAIPASVAPSVKTITVDDNAGCFSEYGAYVRGKSALYVNIDASGSQDSYITSYSTSFDGIKYSDASFTTGVIKGTGSLKMTVTVKDSRGRKATAEKTLTVLSYSAPKISSLSVKRSSDGANLIATFTASVTSLNGKNKLVYATEYKKNTASSYSNKESVTASGASVSGMTRTFAADTASSYDVRLTVTDDFGSVTKVAVGSSVKKLWSALAKGTGFAFGKIASRSNALDMGWPIYMNGNKVTGLPTPTEDSDAIPLASIKAYGLGGSKKITWAEITNAQEPGWYHIAEEENTICGHTASWWYMHVAAYGSGTAHCTQTLYSVSGDKTFERRQNTGTWSEWVNVSPSSYIKYDLLWSNASRTSSFAAQTITVDTTAYNFLAVEVAYNEKEMNGSEICFVGMRKKGYGDTVATLTAHLITSTGSFNTVSRKLTIKSARGSIVADGGIGSGGGASDTNAIPVKIYGVKGV